MPARRLLILTATAALTVQLAVVANPAGAAPASPPTPGSSGAAAPTTGTYDVRTPTTRQQRAAQDARVAKRSVSPAVRQLRDSLGGQGVLDIDATTLTPRVVARLDGFLTAPSSSPAAQVALGYVRTHAAAFGLDAAAVDGLHLARTYVDIAGVSHLSWIQTVGGVPVFDNGLKANVAKDGRLINVEGAPLGRLSAPTAAVRIDGAAAITRAKAATGAARTAPTTGDTAARVVFATAGGTRAAYQVVAMGQARPALAVVDAASGRILFRESLTSDDTDPATPTTTPPASDETALVYDKYPGATVGGIQHPVDLTAQGWLDAGAPTLAGNNVHTYTDVNDDNRAEPTEEVGPAADGSYEFPLQRVRSISRMPCNTSVCTWRPNDPFSWQLNRSQTATQNFYYINKYHDHLAAAPIGFTEAAGNFQQVNRTGLGSGGDPVLDEPLDGADTADGLPDPNHVDNANFATPPDGTSPRMQMYLFHQPGTRYPDVDPFIAASGSDESDVVYHEYTHGLSHRLVVDADNVPALDSQQGGSMGEAWSDWYALDYLNDEGLLTDSPAVGDVLVGPYVLPGQTIRSEPTDCPVGSTAPACPGTKAAGPGGYTYGDFGKISSRGVEVHADGEIWTQTLWDVRTALGSELSESLITRGMELSPTYPSFLDMRNAIIQADVADYRGAHVARLWQLFAARGMGFFAGSVGGNDTSPVEDFHVPPATGTPTATVTGYVRDTATGAGVAGAVVAFGGHDSGFPGSYVATTNAAGRYAIRRVFEGTYPDVYAVGAGYNPVTRTVKVAAPTTQSTFRLQRDWAAASGGASVAATNGDEYTSYGCGPAAMIDQDLGQGWSTDLSPSGKYVTVHLPAAVDISTLQVDPTGTCGDDLVASTADYRIETSTDGTTFVTAASGTFTPSDTGHLVTVPLAAGTGTAVTDVRYTMLTNQAAERGVSCPNGAEGCAYLDSRELEVFGSPAR